MDDQSLSVWPIVDRGITASCYNMGAGSEFTPVKLNPSSDWMRSQATTYSFSDSSRWGQIVYNNLIEFDITSGDKLDEFHGLGIRAILNLDLGSFTFFFFSLSRTQYTHSFSHKHTHLLSLSLSPHTFSHIHSLTHTLSLSL